MNQKVTIVKLSVDDAATTKCHEAPESKRPGRWSVGKYSSCGLHLAALCDLVIKIGAAEKAAT